MATPYAFSATFTFFLANSSNIIDMNFVFITNKNMFAHGTNFCISKSTYSFYFCSISFDLLHFIFEPNTILIYLEHSQPSAYFISFCKQGGKKYFWISTFQMCSFQFNPHVSQKSFNIISQKICASHSPPPQDIFATSTHKFITMLKKVNADLDWLYNPGRLLCVNIFHVAKICRLFIICKTDLAI